MNKKLVRPEKGRVLFGVAAGLANYFEIDPIIIRIIFIALTVWGGAGLVLYIIGIFLIPSEDEKNDKKSKDKDPEEKIKKRVQQVAEEVRSVTEKEGTKKDGLRIFGIVLLIFGILLLLPNILPWFSWGKLWPLLLIIIGILIVAGGKENGRV